jgi:hypothetical protein
MGGDVAPALRESIRTALARQCGTVALLPVDEPTNRPELVAVVDLRPEPDIAAPSSRFGTWRFSWDGGLDAAQAGLAALEAGRRDCAVALVCDGADLDHACIKTIPHSPARTRERLMAAAGAMPARRLRLMLAGIGQETLPPLPALAPVAGLSKGARLRNLAGRVLRERWEEQWQVGVLRQTAEQLVAAPDARRIDWLPPRRNGYHADPFGLAGDSEHQELILAEAYDFRERLGYLVAVGRDGAERTVLREPFHLSFPQIVEHEGQRWLLPEAKAAGCVRLYRPAPWPDQFEPGPVLIEGLAAADPTLYRDDQGFWLFAGDGAAQDETTLVVYHAPDLLGPWRPHPMNPVKVDLGSARPAGPLFRAGGRLWRPAQDCRATYGGAIVLNEVLTLTPELYAERPGPRLAPDPAGPCPHGLHTLTPFGDGFLVDGKREFASLKRWVAGLRSLAHG